MQALSLLALVVGVFLIYNTVTFNVAAAADIGHPAFARRRAGRCSPVSSASR
ncbi:MAG: hypothetical protein HND48_01940 [Chloroflexi bacterium]|nr:hypothetical protein [Chloroflexota bacterium]